MKLFDKLFKTKVKQLINERESLIKGLDLLEKDIHILKYSPRHLLLKEELKRLIKKSQYKAKESFWTISSLGSNIGAYDELNKVNKELEQLIDEIFSEENDEI